MSREYKKAERSHLQTKIVLKLTELSLRYLARNHYVERLNSVTSGQKAKFVFAKPNAEDLVYLKELIEAGKTPVVIDCTYPLVELAAIHDYSRTECAMEKLRRRTPSETSHLSMRSKKATRNLTP